MSSTLVLASSVKAGEVLTLVLPVALFLAVAVWYYLAWRGRRDES